MLFPRIRDYGWKLWDLFNFQEFVRCMLGILDISEAVKCYFLELEIMAGNSGIFSTSNRFFDVCWVFWTLVR